MQPGIPSVAGRVAFQRIDVVGSGALSDRIAVDAWRRRFSELVLPVDVEPLAAGRFVARVGVIMDQQVVAAFYNLSPLCMIRGEDLVQAQDDEVTVSCVLDGTFAAEQNGIRYEIDTGAAVTLVTDRPSLLATPTGGSFVGLRLPKALLAARGLEPDRLGGMILARRTPGLRLLRAYLDQLRREDTLPPALRPMVASHLVDLVAASIQPSLSAIEQGDARGGVREGRLARIRETLEARHTDPDLDLETAARQAGLSVRSLQILLHEEGTCFSDSLRDLRLSRAYALLSSPFAPATVAEIAYAVGFRDVTTFNRAFRRRFGTNPTSVRGGGS
ncbi:AraC family transcriptional regulator [Chthonobacter albigriseus]|uniref:AraC family transcriptional regulator n=1 Tax=Chthonobacter albigriseus TaxID=1683161 RepID=UPI0015EE4D4A|nr:AraC family transcriptional regulator [Chthonobacter albigriseus]